jgi:hypothetical protein
VTIIALHALLLAFAARSLHFDPPHFYLFLCGIASLTHIGGARAAPLFAASFSQGLVPIGILLALPGYILGTSLCLLVATVFSTCLPFEGGPCASLLQPCLPSRCSLPVPASFRPRHVTSVRLLPTRFRHMEWWESAMRNSPPISGSPNSINPTGW